MVEPRGFRPIQFVRDAARNSPWVMIAVALHLIVIAGAAIFYTAGHTPERADEAFVFQPSTRRAIDEPPLKPEELPDRRSVPPNEHVELTSVEIPYVPDAAPVREDLTQEIGNPFSALDAGGGASGAIGVGGAGTRGSGPSAFSERGTMGPGGPPGRHPDRPGQILEEAVLEGLRWLARHQNDDGSWSPATLRERCDSDHPAYNPRKAYTRDYDTGLTGLALLCFLGAGHSHESKADLVDTALGRRHKVGDIVKRGLQWLVKRQNEDGSFSPDRAFLYNESLAAMAVAEAYGLTQSRYFREPAQRAVGFLQAAQRPSPQGDGLWGWRYASRQDIERFHRGAGSQDPGLQKELFDADTSVTGWAIMALKSAQLSGLVVDPRAMEGGAAFARFVTQLAADGRPTGLVGYLDAKGAGAKVTGPHDEFQYHPGTMSALGMCIRIFAQHDVDDPFLRAGADEIVKDLPRVSKDKLSVDYYYWYYASLALNQVDGPDAPKRTGRHWPPWKKAMEEAVLGLQDRAKSDCTRGGWMDLDRWAFDHGGPLYTTALNVLTLEVYYRYPNAFGGGKRN